jgi:pilus assembly protein Flp/PilA
MGNGKKSLSLRSDRRGVTALEYGLIASLIAVVIVASVTSLGTSMAGQFTTIATTIAGAAK